ncbi:DUF4286 family protein [Neptunitalea lumnitzerae]|uniref:DUF4286 family protein n=1 Tax=Neptunitalea lumnitzerae TaxID=2965509 RepID=A0ABQ5MG53_9FLAO|nr:DUF4286 family protein [Neptunitalea sp. Y10]GLB48388.1 hypothetical protein Y10_07560 [Neptunitalea sp. Y10]
MYIYNVTSNIAESVHEEWLKWMQETHIPEILATGKFTNARIIKVLVEEEMGGVTYSVQYTANNKEDLNKYYDEHAEELRGKVLKKFADSIVSFRTELEIISDH